ncbi:MAG: GNAT family N-acetyltransferase [Bdellovibrio sp. CG12_big_fil_rev_8_21_14_0_65_39_13]|nr:MAG: GNAT family N-acetyltransferase [Bdellovibrio sp. CG22_combo_CG10-13_8_21_14_all_39_27]PIQ58031.1 MAG: GNAT family N-acetyltransferase [Bdellovibrio sp. CG12_big_fil_rev_8_21_14_0_65_39_13]PIR36941.1 MAG: GNAT family N-acetyltransferase [Bdellovibrio sp. CG11_big_fil_rev_8_21_14_0_20_39_38]PJB52367.1 MAG: GNAT family N-acetyltransferase [Bdellovibrio sp. CG_4_9_14_3_um_filter_39_7]
MRLEKMNTDQYELYIEREIPLYAIETAKSQEIEMEVALENSQKSFHSLLPNGLETENQFIFNIINDEDKIVGDLWLNLRGDKKRRVYIYNIVIHEKFRGQGFGKKAMSLVEKFAQEKKCESIDLHVFGHNKTARNLYESMGFGPISIVMRKSL